MEVILARALKVKGGEILDKGTYHDPLPSGLAPFVEQMTKAGSESHPKLPIRIVPAKIAGIDARHIRTAPAREILFRKFEGPEPLKWSPAVVKVKGAAPPWFRGPGTKAKRKLLLKKFG